MTRVTQYMKVIELVEGNHLLMIPDVSTNTFVHVLSGIRRELCCVINNERRINKEKEKTANNSL